MSDRLNNHNRNRPRAVRDEETGQITWMTDEDREAFQEFRERLYADLKPEGAAERMVAQGIAHDSWMMNLYRSLPSLANSAAKYTILSRKQNLVASQLRELTNMQTRRRAEREKRLDDAAALAKLNFDRGQTYNPDFDFPPEDGFTITIDEIRARIARNERLAEARRQKKRA